MILSLKAGIADSATLIYQRRQFFLILWAIEWSLMRKDRAEWGIGACILLLHCHQICGQIIPSCGLVLLVSWATYKGRLVISLLDFIITLSMFYCRILLMLLFSVNWVGMRKYRVVDILADSFAVSRLAFLLHLHLVWESRSLNSTTIVAYNVVAFSPSRARCSRVWFNVGKFRVTLEVWHLGCSW
mgnify:CR=1 FL=1